MTEVKFGCFKFSSVIYCLIEPLKENGPNRTPSLHCSSRVKIVDPRRENKPIAAKDKSLFDFVFLKAIKLFIFKGLIGHRKTKGNWEKEPLHKPVQ